MPPQTCKSKFKNQTTAVDFTSPSDSFPPEVLAEIFSLLKGQYEVEFNDRKRLQWIVVTHVSQRWRNIGLSCGALWNNIRSGDPAVTEWLERAGGSGLVVHLTIASVADRDTLVLVLHKLPQIQSLAIQISANINIRSYGTLWKKIQTLLSKPAPMLRGFVLEDNRYQQNTPFLFFADNAPALRWLKLDGCSPIIPSSFLENLTALSICNARPLLNPVELLKELPKMHGLGILCVENALDPIAMDQDDLPVIRPSHLKFLRLGGPHFNILLHFLSRLYLSADTDLLFMSSLDTPDLSAFPRFIDVYNQARCPQVPIPTLKLTWKERIMHLVASDHLKVLTDSPATLTFFLKGPWDVDEFPIPWGEDLVKLPLEDLSYLHVDCKIGDNGWAELSRNCRELNWVVVEGEVAEEFLHHLLEDYELNCPFVNESRGSPSENGDLEPGLLELSVREIVERMTAWEDPAFCSLQTINISRMDFRGDHDLVDQLTMALRDRANYAKLFIQDVMVSDCENFDMNMVEILTEAVSVDWDGEKFPKWDGMSLEEIEAMRDGDEDDG